MDQLTGEVVEHQEGGKRVRVSLGSTDMGVVKVTNGGGHDAGSVTRAVKALSDDRRTMGSDPGHLADLVIAVAVAA